MKYLIAGLLGLLACNYSFAQKFREDTRPQIEKDESNSSFDYKKINQQDILDAIDALGIQIHKFYLGDFDKKYKFFLLADEYYKGNHIKTDTLLNFENVYYYYLNENENPFFDFIDQIKIITKTDDNSSVLKIILYNILTQKEIGLTKKDNRQFFVWREYKETSWRPNRTIPLMIFASSWYDKKYNLYRFCGVTKLFEGDEETKKLLTSSPNYIIISYQVVEI